MSTEMEIIQYVVSLLRAGEKPLFSLHVRRGKDTFLVRIVGTDNNRFQCVAADPKRKEIFFLPHDSIKHGTFILKEISELQS